MVASFSHCSTAKMKFRVITIILFRFSFIDSISIWIELLNQKWFFMKNWPIKIYGKCSVSLNGIEWSSLIWKYSRRQFAPAEHLCVAPSCGRWVQNGEHIWRHRYHKCASGYDLVVCDFPYALEPHTAIQMDDCIPCRWTALCGYSYAQTTEPTFWMSSGSMGICSCAHPNVSTNDGCILIELWIWNDAKIQRKKLKQLFINNKHD